MTREDNLDLCVLRGFQFKLTSVKSQNERKSGQNMSRKSAIFETPGIAGFTATSGAHLAIPISGKPGTSVTAVPAPFEVIPE